MLLSEKYGITVADLCKSNTAIKNGIKNIPTEAVITNLQKVITTVYEPLCDHFDKKLPINSAFRSPALNKAVGGSSTSEHVYGMALDIDGDTVGISNREIFLWIKANLQFGQLIYEFGTDIKPDWVHVSYNTRLQKECLRARKVGKKTNYIPYK